MNLGGITIKNLSGPVSFCILVPDQLPSEIKNKSPILLIGDDHSSNEDLCEKDSDLNINTYSQIWFRLLDSMTSEDKKIDYFIESFFPPKLAQCEDIINDSTSKWLLNTDTDSPMMFLPKYNIECFSKNSEISNKCSTSGIRYHFSDIRLDKSWLKNDFDYEESYESQLCLGLENCLSIDRSRFKTIGNKKLIDILELGLYMEDAKEFAKAIYDTDDTNFKKNSLIYKQVKNFQDPNHEKWRNFFCNYFSFVRQKVDLNLEHIIKIQEGIDNYYHESNLAKPKKRIIKKDDFEYQIIFNNCRKYKQFCEKVVEEIMTPLVDIYILFRIWKQSSPNLFSIINCGNFHTTSISEFLIKIGWYKVAYFYGSTAFDTEFLTPFKNTNYRCIVFYKNVDLYSIIDIDDYKKKIIENRIKYLGQKIYLKMLNGQAIFEDDLIKMRDKISKNLNIDDIAKFLDFKQKFIPSEYSNKIR